MSFNGETYNFFYILNAPATQKEGSKKKVVYRFFNTKDYAKFVSNLQADGYKPFIRGLNGSQRYIKGPILVSISIFTFEKYNLYNLSLE